MSKNVKNIIIGFGKAGKTIAAYLGTQGEETVLIEKSPVMYGGTCINVGCIPTKKIATAAARKKYSQEDAASYYQKSIQEKKLKNVPCDQLSMGMSRDYDMAIQNGSTFVRIGSAFFKENGE
mgnify:CR=1 FL=1